MGETEGELVGTCTFCQQERPLPVNIRVEVRRKSDHRSKWKVGGACEECTLRLVKEFIELNHGAHIDAGAESIGR